MCLIPTPEAPKSHTAKISTHLWHAGDSDIISKGDTA